ncbi:actin-related protein 2/3 complex subunit 5 [Dermacentor andersoni]|nr:actin-related protein 2/3 complex subunit 5-like [Dermacentor andersoni]
MQSGDWRQLFVRLGCLDSSKLSIVLAAVSLPTMSKNTESSTFRKIDIDQYNEDNYKEEEGLDAQSPPAGPDEQEVNHLLNQGKTVDALKIILKTAPIGSKCQSVKDAASALAMRVLLAVKASEMEQAVGSLDRDSVDVLMKYIYRGFESPSEGSSGHLLAWHEKAYAAGGIGSIVRVMTDRKRV